jgi:hypothetical protein
MDRYRLKSVLLGPRLLGKGEELAEVHGSVEQLARE